MVNPASVLVAIFSISYVYGMAPTATLTCNNTAMKISFNKQELDARVSQGTRSYRIYFKDFQSTCYNVTDQAAFISGNDTFIETLFGNTNCGVAISQTSSEIVYSQTVVVLYGQNPDNSLVFREESDEYTVRCKAPRNVTEKLESGSINVTHVATRMETENGTSDWDMTLKRYTDNTFGREDTSDTATLDSTLYFKLVFTTARTDLEINPQQCYAESAGASSMDRVYMIKDRCANADDHSISIEYGSSNKTDFMWKVEAFKYNDLNKLLYVKCQVTICDQGDTSDVSCRRCGELSKRKRRSVITSQIGESSSESDSEVRPSKLFEVKSPAFIVVAKDAIPQVTTEASVSSSPSILSGTKGTIIIVLLALFVFMNAVLIMRKFYNKQTLEVAVAAPSMKSTKGYDNMA